MIVTPRHPSGHPSRDLPQTGIWVASCREQAERLFNMAKALIGAVPG